MNIKNIFKILCMMKRTAQDAIVYFLADNLHMAKWVDTKGVMFR